MDSAAQHLEALALARDAALGEIALGAQAAHAQIDGDLGALRGLGGGDSRPLLADVPLDEPPPYVPPAAATSQGALIADSPLVDTTLSNSSLAFDDAPLWQS